MEKSNLLHINEDLIRDYDEIKQKYDEVVRDER